MSDIRARARARTHADEIDEIDEIGRDLRVLHGAALTRLVRLSDEIEPSNLTNLVTPSLNFVTQSRHTKQQVRSNLTNLVTSQCV